MCTSTEVKKMVYEAFEEEGGMKEQMRAVHRSDINSMLVKLLGGFGLTLLAGVAAFAIYLNTIDQKVQVLEEFAGSGDRFTQQDAALLRQQIDLNTDALKDVARKDDVQDLKEAFIRLDERLRNKGI